MTVTVIMSTYLASEHVLRVVSVSFDVDGDEPLPQSQQKVTAQIL